MRNDMAQMRVDHLGFPNRNKSNHVPIENAFGLLSLARQIFECMQKIPRSLYKVIF